MTHKIGNSKVFLCGGAVRDMLLGIEAKDKDYVVVGATAQQMLDAGYSQVGADFPVFLHPKTGDEYALARRERSTGDGYHDFEVDFDSSVTLEDGKTIICLDINLLQKFLEAGYDIEKDYDVEELIEFARSTGL